jgi:DNA-binding transcriptional regulator PaaX
MARITYVELGDTARLPEGFMPIVRVVRHFRLDPYLPVELLPRDWPGQRFRGNGL